MRLWDGSLYVVILTGIHKDKYLTHWGERET